MQFSALHGSGEMGMELGYAKSACRSVVAAMIAASGSVRAEKSVTYYYTDAQGTVLATTDGAGNVVSMSDYAPYGAKVLGESSNGPGYTGHVSDADEGLIYMQARYYDPAIGRFIAVDPEKPLPGKVFDFNRFSYANNSPMVNIDPDGRNAIITYRANGSIDITVPVRFSGEPAKDPSIVAGIKSSVSAAWSGLYNREGTPTLVNVAIVDVTSSTPKKAVNNIVLTTGPTSDKRSDGASFVRNGNSGEWNVASPGWNQGEPGHETGHLMLEGDRYSETTGSDGKRVTMPSAGFEKNLMGVLGSNASTDSRNLETILSDKKNTVIIEPRSANP